MTLYPTYYLAWYDTLKELINAGLICAALIFAELIFADFIPIHKI